MPFLKLSEAINANKPDIQGIVLSIEKALVAKNKSIYWVFKISDASSEYKVYVWIDNDRHSADLSFVKKGDLLSVTGADIVSGSPAFFSCKFIQQSHSNDLSSLSENSPLRSVKVCANIDVTRLSNDIRAFIDMAVVHPGFKILCSYIATEKFLSSMKKFPAGHKVHHAYEDGLLEHTSELFYMYVGLSSSGPCQKLDHGLVLAAILLHDFGKTKCYDISGDSMSSTIDEPLMDHTFISTRFALDLIKVIEREHKDFLSQNAKKLLAHMILSHHGKQEWGASVVACIKEAKVLHYLDMLSKDFFLFDHTPHMERNFYLGTSPVKLDTDI